MIYEGETPEVTIYHDIKVSLSFDAVEMHNRTYKLKLVTR